MSLNEHILVFKGYIEEAKSPENKKIYSDILTSLLIAEKKDLSKDTKSEDRLLNQVDSTNTSSARPLIDPVERARSEREKEEETLRKAREMVELEGFVKGFDDKFKNLVVENNKLVDINKAEMDDNHKVVKKAKLVLEDKANYNLLPPSQRAVADKILRTNLTNEVSVDLKEVQTLLTDVKTLKDEKILEDLKLNPNRGSEQQLTKREKAFNDSSIIKK
jgi:hypothetical protein